MRREKRSYRNVPTTHPPTDHTCSSGAEERNQSLFSLLLDIESRLRAEARNDQVLSKRSKEKDHQRLKTDYFSRYRE